MSGAWPGYVGYSSVLWHRDLGGMARMWPSSSDMNVQGTGIAGLDSESQATSGLIRTAVLRIDTRRDFSTVGDLRLPFVDHASHPLAIQFIRFAFL